MFVYNFVVKDQFLGVIVQCFSRMLGFTAIEPLSVDESPYLCDELTGPLFPFFSSDVIEIRLLCTCEGCGNYTYNYRRPADAKDD